MDARALALASKRNDYRTNHILHLLLSLVTFGIWIIAWIVIAWFNSTERDKIDRELGRL